ncbi:MAG: hypothetical protein HY706_14625 [Candidatus Hydrogenedentes bacterium]|nr:hypothetical protein [Candidatus Hydrogenedentota bacterium]
MKPAVLLTLLRGIEQVAESLLERADLDIITLYDLTVPLLQQRGIPCRSLNQFITEPQRLRAEGGAARRAAAITEEIYGPAMRALWPQYDDATWSSLQKELVELLRRDLYEEIRLIDALYRCANECDLRLVVVQQDICRDTKTLIYAAHQLGIPSLHTLHGFPYGTTNAHDESFADVVAVFSERAKAIYEGFGVPSERVVVTGNPEWDVYARPMPPGLRKKGCETLGLDPARPIVVYALTYIHRFSKVSALHPLYTHQTTEGVVRVFRDLSEKHPDWQFVLRPHPNDPDAPKNLGALAAEAGLDRVCIDTTTSAAYCLAMADVVVCIQSNLGVEAILVGKPVVNCVIDEFGKPVFLEGMGPLFLEDDAVLFARTLAEIGPAIESVLLDKAMRQWFLEARPKSIRRFNHLNDGKAGERLSAVALDMIARNAAYAPKLARYPEFERALARMVPASSGAIAVIGRAAGFVADAVQSAHARTAVHVAVDTSALPDKPVDTVVFSDPLPHSELAEDWLRRGCARIAAAGMIVASFRNGSHTDAGEAFHARRWAPLRPGAEAPSGLGEYSELGVRVLLSRIGLEPVELVPVSGANLPKVEDSTNSLGTNGSCDQTLGWVIVARLRSHRPGDWAESREAARRRALELNQVGETSLAAGDLESAAAKFREAIIEWPEEAIIHNNLGAVLFHLGRNDEAWRCFLAALHCDPNLQSARANLLQVAASSSRTAEAKRILEPFGSDSIFTQPRRG